jgi:repressor LexA
MSVTAEIETPPAGLLTDKQRAIYDWIVDFCESHGYSPTVRELANAFGLRSTNGAVCHLKPLAKKGWIRWTPHRSRTMRPIGGLK